jgi:putative transposase
VNALAHRIITSDHQSSSASTKIKAWTLGASDQARKVGLGHRLHGKMRSECLNAHWFLSLQAACDKLEAWRTQSNEERPHTAIGNIPLIKLAKSAGETSPPDPSAAEKSRFEWSEVG